MIGGLIKAIQQQMQSWFSQATDTEAESGLTALPDLLQVRLAHQLQSLPSPIPYQTTLQAEITTAVDTWQQNLDAPNTLVFLGSPVDAIAKVVQDSIDNWSDPPLDPIMLSVCQVRPSDPLTIQTQIREAIQSYPAITDDPNNDEAHESIPHANQLDQRRTLLIIPCLDQWFLRCIGGWDGIEYFRDIAVKNQNCFWVIGCNRWAWNFLDFVCQISAYFNHVCPLPELEADALQDWLSPAIESLSRIGIEISHAQSSESDRPLSDWDALAKRSSGIGSIAANLWAQSLQIAETDLESGLQDLLALESTEPENPPKTPLLTLYEKKPSLPSLLSLTVGDRYLLHSVLIHGQITRSHLALSLGEAEGMIQSQVQVLLREDVLEQRSGYLSVQAVHYAKLKTELINNNFFVGDD